MTQGISVKEITDALNARMAGHVHSMCATEDEVSLAYLLCEIDSLKLALEGAKLFAEWVEILGRTDCEIYKHELKHCADLAIERIAKQLEGVK